MPPYLPPLAPPLARGVYAAAHRHGGARVLFAVDSRGERVMETAVPPQAPPHTYASGATEPADEWMYCILWGLLDELDPQPRAVPAEAPADTSARFRVADGGGRPARGRRRARPTLTLERGGASRRRPAPRGDA